jgi:hypothetical protein
LAKAIATKPEEKSARDYVDHLILEQLTDVDFVVKLGELADKLSDQGIGLATVRSLLASNPERFAYYERKWIPAARLLAQGRPFSEAAYLTLQRIGAPVGFDLLLHEVARIRRESSESLEPTLRRLVERDPRFFPAGHSLVCLSEWCFDASDETVARALAINKVTDEEFAAAGTKLAGVDWRNPDAVKQALLKVAPIRLKVFGAVAWSVLSPADPKSVLLYTTRQFNAPLLADADFVLSPDGTIAPRDLAKRWVTTAANLAEKLTPSVELDDAAPIEVKPADVTRMATKISANGQTTTAIRLLEEFYEITPGTKTFPDDLRNVVTALQGESSVQWVGGDRFRKAADVPEYIHEVPEPFLFVQTENENEEGELVDVELNDDGLSSSLRKLLQHPLATDVLDEEIAPAPKTMPESVRLVLKSIHRELGTFPLSQLPTSWLDGAPNVQELIFRDPSGRELQVWVNQEARLMYNLFDWWYEQPIESGAVFTLTKTNRPNVLEFAWLDQPDPVVYISSQRMEELRRIGSEADGKSTLDLLIEAMNHWPKGADYLTILAEVNVIRRCSRRLIASLLSSYQCFYQRSGSPVWHFDPKKVELGFDKTKRKFVKK